MAATLALALIGLDIATSACKAIAVGDDGAVLARASAAYPMATPRPGWAEQDPADWQRGAGMAMRALADASPRAAEVRGIGLSGQMHGLVALDADDRVLRPAILWCDNRTAVECDEITEAVGGADALLGLTSNRMLPGFTGGNIAWLRRHEPERHARMRRVLLPKDALRLLMAAEHATDGSDASGTGLFDARARCWSRPMLDAVGLDPDQVPRALESHERTGTPRPAVAVRWGLPPWPRGSLRVPAASRPCPTCSASAGRWWHPTRGAPSSASPRVTICATWCGRCSMACCSTCTPSSR